VTVESLFFYFATKRNLIDISFALYYGYLENESPS
jgi:hypothetical protein